MSDNSEASTCRKLIGMNIRRIRQEKSMTQEELAFQADMHRGYLSEVETGRRNISADNICKIAHGLDVDPRELLTPVEEWEQDPDTGESA